MTWSKVFKRYRVDVHEYNKELGRTEEKHWWIPDFKGASNMLFNRSNNKNFISGWVTEYTGEIEEKDAVGIKIYEINRS